MTPTITARHGAQDGISWGNVTFEDTTPRRFVHDLLTGTVRLYRHPSNADYGGDSKFTEDTDAERIDAVLRELCR